MKMPWPWREGHARLRERFRALLAESQAIEEAWHQAVAEGDFSRQSTLLACQLERIAKMLTVMRASHASIHRYLTEANQGGHRGHAGKRRPAR